MSREISNDQHWLEDNQAGFARANEIAGRIGEQNQLHSDLIESGRVTLEPFQKAAADYLAKEQAQTFQNLIEASDEAPYEELAARECRLRADMGEIAAKLSLAEERQQEAAALIRQEQDLVAGSIPQLAPKLSEIAARLEQDMVEQERANLESEQAALESAYQALIEAYEIAGRDWPVPRLINTPRQQLATEDAEPGFSKQPDLIEVDDFSQEPAPPAPKGIAEKLRRRYPEAVLRDASEFVALLLAEEPGSIYTLDELAEALYGPDERNRKNRVSALVSNFERGRNSIIGCALRERGLVFQRGKRTSYLKSTGEPYGVCHPVFRAVPIQQTGDKDPIVHSDESTKWTYDGWHSVVYDGVVPEMGDDSAEAPASPAEPEKAPGAAVAKHSRSVPISEPEAAVSVSETGKKPEPEWLQKFRKDVGETIAQFEDDGLMVKDAISWRLARVKSSHGIVGTETMAERAIRFRIISKNEGGVDGRLPIYKIICMALQNRYPEVFSSRPRRKQAMRMVEQTVADYFAESGLKRQ